MFDKVDLVKAVNIKEQTYCLIRWLNSAINIDVISPPKAIANSASFGAAKAWIVEHFYNFPTDGRPDSLDAKDIDPFCYLFISHFSSSLDIIEDPGQRYIPHDLGGGKGCYADNPHIQAKKIGSRDKSKARSLKINYLRGLAIEIGKPKSDACLESLVDNPDLKVKVAIATYGMLLISRMKGCDIGKANLALWREFAWNSYGSPKHGFKLNADEIMKDELYIIEKLNE